MLNNLSATVLFVQDLEKCRTFYEDVFGLGKPYADASSAAYKMGEHDFVLLKRAAAAEMVGEEAIPSGKPNGSRVLLCLAVENVDATCEALQAKGVSLIKPPKSQAWGRRTAYFADPEGNLWELWHSLPSEEK